MAKRRDLPKRDPDYQLCYESGDKDLTLCPGKASEYANAKWPKVIIDYDDITETDSVVYVRAAAFFAVAASLHTHLMKDQEFKDRYDEACELWLEHSGRDDD